jgi:hypothetical protein
MERIGLMKSKSKKTTKYCKVCGNGFEVYKTTAHRHSCCSRECTKANRKGANNANYKDGFYHLRHRYNTLKDRCTKPFHASYQYYGAKGVECRIEKEEFVAWFVENCNGDFSLTVDRIDNDGHYELSNMRLITRSENIAKSNRETKRNVTTAQKTARNPRSEKVKIGDRIFNSLREAGRAFGSETIVKSRLRGSGLMPDGTKIEMITE